MLERFIPDLAKGRSSPLPRRQWRIRSPRAFLYGMLGAALGSVLPLVAWWYLAYPLWFVLVPMLIGWLVLMPRPLVLGLDERGVALIRPGWSRDDYLWIPQDRLARVEVRQGWLVASGTTIEQQGTLNWLDAAVQVGATIPPWVNLLFQSGLAAAQIGAPIHLLDELARDEIELWIYRQGK